MKNLNDFILNFRGIFLLLFVMFISYTVANIFLSMELNDFLKKFLIIVICILFLKVAASTSMENLVILLILMLPFPIFINIGSKDVGTTNTLAIYLVFIIYVVRKIIRKEPIFSDRPLFYMVLFLIVAYVVSFANTPWFARESALRRFSVFISCIIIFYLVINDVKTKKTIVRIIDAMSVASFLEAIVVIYQLLFPTKSSFLQIFGTKVIDLDQRYSALENLRIAGTFGFDYEIVSEFFAINILIHFFIIQKLKKSFKRKLYIMNLAFLVVAMISTGTRGGIIALFAVIMLVSFFAKKNLKITKNFILIFTLGTLFFGTIFFFSENIPYLKNLYERFTKTEFQGIVPDTRIVVWKVVLPIIMENPWIGHGPQAIGDAKLVRYANPHSMYLYYLFNIGIIGTVGVLCFFGAVFWRGYATIKRHCDNEIVFLTIVLIGAFMVFVVDEYKISYQRHSNMQQFVWIIFALIVSLSRVAGSGNGDDSKIFKS